MPFLRIHAPSGFENGLARIRDEFDVTTGFSREVLHEAQRAHPGFDDRADRTALELIAIDPRGARDLDQALSAVRTSKGYRVHYAIADVGAFVAPGSFLDQAAMARGATIYMPDERAPLHPRVLSEDRASLRAGEARPCLLWSFDLDVDGRVVSTLLERAVVRVHAAISYADAQDAIDRDSSEVLGCLKRIGLLRRAIEEERGGVSINVPTQEVRCVDGRCRLEFENVLPVEQWNAQISLMTGMQAAAAMADAGVGILRTLPEPVPADLQRLRTEASVLGLHWAPSQTYAGFVRTLIGNDAASAAFLHQSVRLLRGAGYAVLPAPGPTPTHGAIGAPYAHVTAPLRRLVDRFANEILLALFAGREPPGWASDRLEELPKVMARVHGLQGGIDRAVIDLFEAIVLDGHVGDLFTGHVVDLENASAVVQLDDHPIVVSVEQPEREWTLAQPVSLELRSVDVDRRTVEFQPAAPSAV